MANTQTGIILTKQELEILIRNPGHGVGLNNKECVKLLVIGNESGLGDAPNEKAFIDYLVRRNLKDDLIPKIDTNSSYPRRSDFLKFISRLRLFLQDGDEKWFAPSSKISKEDNNIILKTFSGNDTHLIDIRPLPRVDESTWNYNFSASEYLKSCRTFTSDIVEINYLIQSRISYLQSLIRSFENINYIVAPGDPSMKLSFLNQLFHGIEFKLIVGNSKRKSGSKLKRNDFWVSEYVFEGRKIKILVSNFFNNRNGIKYEGLAEVGRLLVNRF